MSQSLECDMMMNAFRDPRQAHAELARPDTYRSRSTQIALPCHRMGQTVPFLPCDASLPTPFGGTRGVWSGLWNRRRAPNRRTPPSSSASPEHTYTRCKVRHQVKHALKPDRSALVRLATSLEQQPDGGPPASLSRSH
ncbi:hypothetical protein BST61_g9749 [Cercospora zeina]